MWLLNWGMNGCASSSFSIVNAEDNSMGGVVEGGIGIVDDTSPRKVAIDKVQAELRQRYNVREETKRELEFLEKGGNLLDYKSDSFASVSVQSTSFTDQQKDRLVVNDAKCSSAFVTSSHGDSVESSGEPAVVPSEANSADNLLPVDAETEFSEGGRSLSHHFRRDFKPQDLQVSMNKTQKHGDSAVFTLPRKAYKRRNRTRPSREGARSSSTNVEPAATISKNLKSEGFRDVKNLKSEGFKQDVEPAAMPISIDPVEDTVVKNVTSCELLLNDLDCSKSVESSKNHVECASLPTRLDFTDSSDPLHVQLNQGLQSSAARSPNSMRSEGPEMIEMKSPAVIDCQSVPTSVRVDDQIAAREMNGFKRKKVDEKSNDAQRSNDSHVELMYGRSGSDELHPTVNISESNTKKTLPDGTSVLDARTSITLKKDYEETGDSSLSKQEAGCVSQNLPENELLPQIDGLSESISNMNKRELAEVTVGKIDTSVSDLSESDRKRGGILDEYPNVDNEVSGHLRNQEHVDSSVLSEAKASVADSSLDDNIDEDSILKEAEIIEERRKKNSELSTVTSPIRIGHRQRSQWDYVLEEMTWLSNDFAQERMWKISAAAQMSFRVAVNFRLRQEAKSSVMDAKRVARTLSKAVLDFWDSVDLEATNELIGQKTLRSEPIRAYAAKFAASHKLSTVYSQADLSLRQDKASDLGLPDLPEDNIAYENIFYPVPPGAMEAYRKSIVSHVVHIENLRSYVQEEVETSAYDGVNDYESQGNVFDEDEDEDETGSGTFNMPGAFESSISSGYGRKKIKHLKHGHGMGSYEMRPDALIMQRSEIKLVKRESGLLEKRPGSSLNASVPTKRVRTASRRVISTFSAGPSGNFQLLNKADASSGDTSSLQDDLSTLHSGLVYPNAMEAESARDFQNHSPYESAELTMPKRKKAKHMNVAYDQQWQADSNSHDEQRDRFKRRFDSHMLESNGTSGLYGQHLLKKKVLRQSRDHSFDSPSQIGASVPSPVTSHTSNIHNSNKLVKIFGVRDRVRKVKGPKIPTGQPGSGSIWSVFEDQALVVLVHDFGPHWELISDAFNSALHFKCVFRNAKECKDRHYTLMDRNSGDGADSAEDYGSSQPYPSALPGIPKGTARLLFQRLQGPVEEDTLKSHFEKIIMIGQKSLHRRSQDPKQLHPPHSSHSAALSQVFPNNLSGGPILTPLDLCDVQSPDVFQTGMQVVHTAGSSVPNQGMANPLLPASGARSALQGSPNMTAGANFPSSPGTVNAPARDGRHVIPRCGPLSADEKQKIQHYNQMLVGRNVSQPSLPAPGNDRGVRINSSGSPMGVICSSNRTFPMARPGLQGASSTPLVNSGNMVSPAASPSMHPGLVTGYASPIPRPHDALQMMRPGVNQDPLRQMMMPDLQMPGAGQGVPHRGGLSSPISNQNAAASPQRHQPFSRHPAYYQGPANHAPNPQQQAYGPRLAKERQMPQQRLMLNQPQPQQQKFAPPNSLVPPHVQSQPQLPLGSPMQTGSQVQPPKGSPVSHSPVPPSSAVNSMPQNQQKHQGSAVGVVQNTQSGGGLAANHSVKLQSRQHHLPQSNRQHPQRQLQAQQQVKVSKGRGNLVQHPNDSPVANGVSVSSGAQPPDFTNNQGLFTNSMQPTRPSLVNKLPSQSYPPQQKINSGQGTSAPKHIQSQSDSSNQSHASPVVPVAPVANAAHQSGPSLVVSGALSHQNAPQRHTSKSGQAVSPSTPHSWQASEPLSDGVLQSPNNQGSMVSLSSNSYEPLPQEGQGLRQRPPTIKHEANAQWQQQQQEQQHKLEPQSPISQMQQPPVPAQAPQQNQLLQSGNGNSYGRSSEPRLE